MSCKKRLEILQKKKAQLTFGTSSSDLLHVRNLKSAKKYAYILKCQLGFCYFRSVSFLLVLMVQIRSHFLCTGHLHVRKTMDY